MAYSSAVITHIIMVLALLACYSCSPIKHPVNQYIDNTCNGKNCVVKVAFPEDPTGANFPDNLTNAVLAALPSIVEAQNKIVGLLQNQTETQRKLAQSQQVTHNQTASLLHDQRDALQRHDHDLQLQTMDASVKELPADNVTKSALAALPKIVDSLGEILDMLNHQADTQNKLVNLLQSHQNVLWKHNQQLKSIANNNTVEVQSEGDSINTAPSRLHYNKDLHTYQDLLQHHDQKLQNLTSTLTVIQAKIERSSASLIPPPRDCADIAAQGHNISKPYRITPFGEEGYYTVYCDLESDGGGWTVFQHRCDGSVDFYRTFLDFEHGFGNPDREHWAGLRFLRQMTRIGTWELMIELEDFSGNVAYAHYASFRVGDRLRYQLSFGEYNGTAGNAFTKKYQEFFTRDNYGSCGRSKGAWWYERSGNCGYSNLNGQYLGPSHDSYTSKGMYWYTWKNSYESLKRSTMKMRRIH